MAQALIIFAGCFVAMLVGFVLGVKVTGARYRRALDEVHELGRIRRY